MYYEQFKLGKRTLDWARKENMELEILAQNFTDVCNEVFNIPNRYDQSVSWLREMTQWYCDGMGWCTVIIERLHGEEPNLEKRFERIEHQIHKFEKATLYFEGYYKTFSEAIERFKRTIDRQDHELKTLRKTYSPTKEKMTEFLHTFDRIDHKFAQFVPRIEEYKEKFESFKTQVEMMPVEMDKPKIKYL